jgi:predicted O-methyltransferase YrrM
VNKDEIVEVYERCASFALDPEVESRITGSTLDVRALKFVGTLIKTINPVHWMEFGSGLSTFFSARLLSETPNARLYTVDHSDYYLEQTRQMCFAYENISYFYAPITPYRYGLKDFLTYNDNYAIKIPRNVKFDVVLIDGPLGFRYGREAPLYQIAAHLKPETIIVLDDAGREPEQRAIANWQRVWGNNMSVEFFPGHKGLAVIQIHEPAVMRRFPFRFFEIWQSWQSVQERLKNEGGRTSSFYQSVSFSLSMWSKARWKFHELCSKIFH